MENNLYDIHILIKGWDVIIDPFPKFHGGKNGLWR